MPAGTDLITWSPRLGSTGDDRYDPGADVAIKAGDSSGFSVVPTVAQINASSGVNQILGEIGRRVSNSTTHFVQATVTVPTYVVAGNRIKAADFSGLQSKINAIRRCENHGDLNSFTFTVTPAVGLRISRQDILEMRKALATDRISIYILRTDILTAPGATPGLQRNGLVWRPNGASLTPNAEGMAAHYFDGANYIARRAYFPYRLPAGLPALGAAANSFYALRNAGLGTADFTASTYRPTTFGVQPSTVALYDAMTLDNLESSELQSVIAPSTTVHNLYSAAVASGVLGSSVNVMYILCSDRDGLNIAPTDMSYSIETRFSAGNSKYPILKLYTS